MILKGSQRGGGANLAAHLMRMDDNEHLRLHELRGFTADTLKGAFKEIEAVSRGTKCRQYLFSLSLNPPGGSPVAVKDFERAIARAEERLGLEGQPRAIVFHEKEGRRHAHCVWSRIDAETMTARPLPFFKQKLTGLSRELFLDHGWDLPKGLETPGLKSPLNFSLAEWQQAKRAGVDPRALKESVQACWKQADTGAAFARALEDRALFLAKGDRRAVVLVDHTGEVHALSRVLGLKTKEVRARLGDGEDLPAVDTARAQLAARITPMLRRHIEDSRAQFANRSATLGAAKEEMTQAHRSARAELETRLGDEQRREAQERAARLPRGLSGLWQWITGRYRELRLQNEVDAQRTAERHAREREALIAAQQAERAQLQQAFNDLRREQAERLWTLRSEVGRYLWLTKPDAPALREGLGARTGSGLKLSRSNTFGGS